MRSKAVYRPPKMVISSRSQATEFCAEQCASCVWFRGVRCEARPFTGHRNGFLSESGGDEAQDVRVSVSRRIACEQSRVLAHGDLHVVGLELSGEKQGRLQAAQNSNKFKVLGDRVCNRPMRTSFGLGAKVRSKAVYRPPKW